MKTNPLSGIRLRDGSASRCEPSYVRDASGNVLGYGDSIALNKDVKV